MKFEELESSPNKSLKSLTEGSGLTSVLTVGGGGREGTGGRGSRGMFVGSCRSKSGPNRSCCNLDGAGSALTDPPEGPNPRIDCKDLLSSLGLGGGAAGLVEYPGFVG